MVGFAHGIVHQGRTDDIFPGQPVSFAATGSGLRYGAISNPVLINAR